MSPASVDSQWVQEEIRMALHKGIAGRKFNVIPILKEDCKIPSFLRDRKYVDMRLAADYPAGLEKIVRKIRGKLEFKDSLQRFRDDLQGLEAHDPELTRELGTEKVGDIEHAISMVPRAISGQISEREWTQAADQLKASLGKGDVTFDQHNQRVKHQINIGTLTVNLPIAPTTPDPEELIEFETAFRQRIRKRFSEDAPYYIELSGETTEVNSGGDGSQAPRSARRRRQRMRAEYREWIQEGRDVVRVKLNTLREAFIKYPCVILLGDPGCGKTTALQQLAYEVAEEDGRLPVPLRLSEYAPKWTSTQFRDYKYNQGDGREDPDAGDKALLVLRGGSWLNLQDYARCPYRSRYFPIGRDDISGFRVVASPISAL